MMRQNDAPTGKTLSRGSFVRSAALSAIGATLLAATGKARAAAPTTTLLDLAGTVMEAWSGEPGFPGGQDLAAWVEESYPKGLSTEDQALLRGALYLKADALAQAFGEGITPGVVLEVLAKPLGLNPLSGDFFEAVLASAQESAAKDPTAAARLSKAGKDADALAAQLGGDQGTFILIFLLPFIIFVLICIILE